MRLAQLSRKFSVRPAEIVDLLARHNIALEPSANAKVEGAALTIVIAHFAPQSREEDERGQEIVVSEPPTELSETSEPVEAPEPVAAIEETKPSEEPQSNESEELTLLNEVGGVIKAPKVELKGLKVLGKIELPEPRKKEEAAPKTQEESREERPGTRPENRERKERRQRTSPRRDSRNPVALERERLAREAAEKRKEEIEREKERRKQHYHKKVNPKGPTKAVRRFEEHETLSQEPEKPKSLWGKIVRWLTT